MQSKMIAAPQLDTASKKAATASQVYSKTLAMRIFLKRSEDLANCLPVDTRLRNYLESTREDLVNVLQDLLVGFCGNASSSRNATEVTLENLWSSLQRATSSKRLRWETVINKWQSRLRSQSVQLKSFSNSIWDQISIPMADENRVIEKSRKLLRDSSRLDKDAGEVGGDSSQYLGENTGSLSGKKRGRDSTVYDLEVFDDRQFYSMLLKTFISSATAGESGVGKEEILAMKRYKNRNQQVDRKASKGRKIRYVLHSKLQNFMFPIKRSGADSDIDRHILFGSLFQ